VNEPIYLDHNATTPPHPEVLEAMQMAARESWANPASVHRLGQRARAQLDSARRQVADLVGFHPRDVVLTSGGTEANNLALRHPFKDVSDAGLVLSRLEHPSVLRTAEALAHEGVAVAWVEPRAEGDVLIEDFMKCITELDSRAKRVRLVCLQAVNHETGVVQPVAALAAALEGHDGLLHVDAVQAVGKLDPGAWAGADSVSVAAHKIQGPKGIGALLCRPGIVIHPLLRGGQQERGIRPGTQDPIAAAGFAVAAERAARAQHRSSHQALAPLRDSLEKSLFDLAAELGIAVRRNGTAGRVAHVSNMSWSGWRGPELCAALDLEGVAVASGAACSAGTATPSAVVAAMLGPERAGAAVRISLGEGSTAAQVRLAVAAFGRVLGRASGSGRERTPNRPRASQS